MTPSASVSSSFARTTLLMTSSIFCSQRSASARASAFAASSPFAPIAKFMRSAILAILSTNLVQCLPFPSDQCQICKKERLARKLVATDGNDPRFQEEKIIKAPAVFPNNDSKYDVNKKRSLNFAASKGQGIMYCIAKDTPSSDALRERPDLPARKLEFLSRHDRESGDLYGILPLIQGMPVAMTDHIDRSIDKRILRGRVGYVHSWILDDHEDGVFENGKRILKKMSKVIFIKLF